MSTANDASACSLRQSTDSAPALGPERPVAWPKRTVRTLVERPASGARRNPHVSENYPRSFFSAAATPLSRTARPGLAEMTATVVRTGTASRTSRQIEEDLRRMGADLGTHAGADTSAISVSGLAEFSGGVARIDGRPRAQRLVSRGRIRARAPPAIRRASHRAHHARLSRERTLAPRAVRRASVCHRRAHRRAGRRLPRASNSTSFIASIMCPRMRC